MKLQDKKLIENRLEKVKGYRNNLIKIGSKKRTLEQNQRLQELNEIIKNLKRWLKE